MVTIPSTSDYWYDQSYETTPEVTDLVNRPLMMAMFSSDKGPTGWRKIHGRDFFKLYGASISAAKHGQPLLQAAYTIANGGELLCNRVVANDSSVANTILLATVKQIQTQKVNAEGEPLYIDNITQQETTEEQDSDGTPNEKAYINTATIKWSVKTVTNANSYVDDIQETLAGEIVEEDGEHTYTYPIFTIMDNGPGASTKRFKFSTNYTLSRTIGFAVHQLIYCGTQDFDYEYVNFSTVPGLMYNGSSMSAEVASNNLLQMRCYEYSDGINKLYERLTAITGVDTAELETYDLLFAKSIKDKALDTISIDNTGLDLGADIGIPLSSGSNGEFGDAPFGTTEYENALLDAFDEEKNPQIYDLDRYQIDACIDANYPKNVKKKLVELAEFRKDFFFYGDLGLGVNSVDAALNYMMDMPHGSHKFSAWAYQHGDIVDPYTSKYVAVTLGYGLARVMCSHLVNSYHEPYSGVANEFTFPEYVNVNHIPVITPSVNQKQQLIENQINYATIINDVLTMETEYTSYTYQGRSSALMYLNNVAAIQTVIKDVRRNCPKFRQTFTDTNDANSYAANVNKILKKYKDDYKQLTVEFGQDELMRLNKLFEVNLKVVHKDFYQAERLNIYTMSIVSS